MGFKISSFVRTIIRASVPCFIGTFIGCLIFFDHYVREQNLWTIVSVSYVALQIYGNWIQIHRHKTKERDVTQRMGVQVQKFRCDQCDGFHGPLLHYCPLCDQCMFKHDKHCIFVGTCIGFKNRIYFIGFCAFASIGSIYGLLVYYTYFRTLYPSSELSVSSVVLPLALWQFATGRVDVITLVFSFLFYFLIVVVAFTSVLVLWQIAALKKFSKKMIEKKDNLNFETFLVFEPKYDLWNIVMPFVSDIVRAKSSKTLPYLNRDLRKI